MSGTEKLQFTHTKTLHIQTWDGQNDSKKILLMLPCNQSKTTRRSGDITIFVPPQHSTNEGLTDFMPLIFLYPLKR